MRRYTTSTQTFIIKGVDLTSSTKVRVTYRQKSGLSDGTTLTITNPTVAYSNEQTTVTVTLTQEQTASFSKGKADVQVNWITSSGVRKATREMRIAVDDNLLEEVLSYV